MADGVKHHIVGVSDIMQHTSCVFRGAIQVLQVTLLRGNSHFLLVLWG